MLAKSRACSRAVQARLQSPIESIWVSEDSLARAFERFCVVSIQPRRHGSFVPGPMEGQRRLGKRKMTLVSSEAAYSPPQGFGSLWGFPGDSDMSNWQWQAPSLPGPSVEKEEASLIPRWLRDFIPLDKEEDVTSRNGEQPFSDIEHHSDVKTFYKDFIRSMDAARLEDIDHLCETFNQKLKQSLSLGLVPEPLLSPIIGSVSRSIRKHTSDTSVQSSRLLAFFQSTWDGIRGCNLLQPSDLESTGLTRLLAQISRLPLNTDVQNLIVEILKALSFCQLNEMKRELLALRKIWISNHNNHANEVQTSLIPTFQANIELESGLLERNFEFAIALSDSLATISFPNPNEVILHFTNIFSSTTANNDNIMPISNETRLAWLSTLAKSSWISPDLFMEILSKMNLPAPDPEKENGRKMTLDETCHVLVEYLLVRQRENVLKYSFCESETTQRNKLHRKMFEALFRMFAQFDRKLLYVILRSLDEARVNTRLTFFKHLTKADRLRFPGSEPSFALRLLKTFVQLDQGHLPHYLQNVVVELIKDTNVHPHDIWRALQLPFFLPISQWGAHSRPNAKDIHFIHTMARAFSQATHRSSRVTLRNIRYCYLYLLSHGQPVTAGMSRIFISIGITRDMLEKGYIREEKLQWVLDIVNSGEGPEVARQVHAVTETAQREVALRNRA